VASITVLGLGRMGGALAKRLSEAGHNVAVWNRTPAVSRAFAAALAPVTPVDVASSPQEAVIGAELVISILATGEATTSVLLAPEVRSALAPSAVVCDMATSGVDAARQLAKAFAADGIRFVDAPVSGSVATVAAGQLLVMGSGDRSGVDEATAMLSAVAKKVVYLGPAGAGQAMKLAVNLLLHTLNAGTSEALALASASGIAQADAYDVFLDSVIASPFLTYKRQAYLDANTPVAMSLELTRKDLGLIVEHGSALGLTLPTAERVHDLVAEACVDGWGSADMAALTRFVSGSTAL
jgi:3-hydroxyisobutyrate dehydrogenase